VLKLKIPPPIYTLSMALVMWCLYLYAPVVVMIESPWNMLGVVAIVLAAFLDFSSLYLFFRKRTTPSPMKPEFTTRLVVNGMYKFSRNPMYLGMFIMLFGFAIFLGALSPFLILPAYYFLLTEMQIKPEEKILEDKFGDEYLYYKSKVRRWL